MKLLPALIVMIIIFWLTGWILFWYSSPCPNCNKEE